MPLLCLLLLSASADGGTGRPFVLPVRLAVVNESIALPSVTRLFTNFNPGLEVGSELRYLHNDLHTLYQGLNAGLVFHPSFGTSVTLGTAFGWRPTLVAGLFLDVGLSVAYLLRFSESSLYVAEGGSFRPTAPLLHRFLGGLGLALGYRLGNVAPFVGYSLQIEAPFLEKFSPVLPHQFLQLGVRLDLPLGAAP